MNNEQFRRLLVNNTPKGGASPSEKPGTDETQSPQSSRRDGGATPAMFGSRMRSSIPMTPRSLSGVDFAHQLAEHRRDTDPQQRPSKRFKSSAAPKGTKLPTGYQDRAAQLRQLEEEAESQGKKESIEDRIRALEEMVLLGQIDRGTFEKLRTELGVGGDVDSTHMVKGLDWQLLKRVRAGEDVSKAKEKEEEQKPVEGESVEDLDDEFDRVTEEKGRDVASAGPKEKREKKKGTMAPPPVKRSRDEILRELKASRAAASQPPPPVESELGDRFKRIQQSKAEKKRWIEHDENGRRREVLLITDAEGKSKRKTRWLDKPGESNGNANAGLLVPDKAAKPLGMEVPAEIASKIAVTPDEDEDDDIFAGVGADYNPLGDLGEEDSSSSDSDEDGEVPDARDKGPEKAAVSEDSKKPTDETSNPRNYFATSTSAEAAEPDERSNPMKDPTILATLKRAAALRQASPSAEGAEGDDGADADTILRRKKFLEEARRRDALDAMDMDMGFGGSRNEDGEDEEELLYDDRGGNKRKRGPKKRKGDKDSASDVLRVMEGRKKD